LNDISRIDFPAFVVYKYEVIIIIYFSDEFLEQLGFEKIGNRLIVAGEEYTIKSAVDCKNRRGYMVVKSTKK